MAHPCEQPDDTPRDPLGDEVQRHGEAVRSLARALVAPADADDLAQEVWLVRSRPDATRPEMPGAWNRRVAQNLAARLRLGERRRRARERRVARPERDERTPETQAVLAESIRRVADAVTTLPEPYRAAVVARFYEDQPPRVIAERTGVPVETVKSRLKRGLALLRAHLDERSAGDRAAWAAPLLGWLGPSPAPAVATAGGSTALLLILTMKTRLLAVAALALALGAASLWVAWPSAFPDARREMATVRAPRTDARHATRIPTDPPNVARDRVANEPTPATGSGRSLQVVGRLVAAEDGRPLADATVELRTGDEVHGTARSDATGDFRVALRAAADDATADDTTTDRQGLDLQLRIRAAGRDPLGRSWKGLRRRGTLDLGTLPLEARTRVTLRVLDHSGAPLAHGEVAWDDPAASLSYHRLLDARGEVVWELPPGPQTFAAIGYDLVRSTIEIPEAADDTRVTLHTRPLDPSSTLQLLLVDQHGTRLDSVSVTLEPDQEHGGRRLQMSSRANGVVQIDRVSPGSRYRIVAAERASRSLPLPAGSPPIRPGREPVTLRFEIPDPGRHTVRLLDPEGRPVVGAEVATAATYETRFPRSWARTDAQGEARLTIDHRRTTHVVEAQRRWFLFVEPPAGSGLVRVFGHPLDVGLERTTSETLNLERGVSWTVEVRQPDGRPVADAELRLVRGSHPLSRSHHRDPGDWLRQRQGSDFGTTVATVTRHTRTDAAGRARFTTETALGHAALDIRSPRHRILRAPLPEQVAAGALVPITLEPTTSLLGQLEPLEVVTGWGPPAEARALAALHVDAEAYLAGFRIRVEARDADGRLESTALVDDQGRFRLDNLPAGELTLRAEPEDGPEIELGTLVAGPPDEPPMQRTFQLDAHRPARLRGTLLRDGAPWPFARLRGDGPGVQVTTDAEGRFDWWPLAPGRQTLSVVPVPRGSELIPVARELQLLPGEERAVQWQVNTAGTTRQR